MDGRDLLDADGSRAGFHLGSIACGICGSQPAWREPVGSPDKLAEAKNTYAPRVRAWGIYVFMTLVVHKHRLQFGILAEVYEHVLISYLRLI